MTRYRIVPKRNGLWLLERRNGFAAAIAFMGRWTWLGYFSSLKAAENAMKALVKSDATVDHRDPHYYTEFGTEIEAGRREFVDDFWLNTLLAISGAVAAFSFCYGLYQWVM
jgi:hypothetical protein